MSGLVGMISEALASEDPRYVMRRTKELVRRKILEVEPRADIHETEYFDHTFAPDFVLRRGTGLPADRWVFLRTTNAPDELAADLQVPSHESNVYISLDRFREGAERDRAALGAASTARNALVIDTPALDELGDNERRPPTTTVLTRALVSTGRGLLDELDTASVLERFASGVNGAIEGRDLPTRSAATDARQFLTAEGAAGVTSFLGALWEGGGRSRTEFPGGLDLSPINEVGLSALLEGPEILNEVLWDRLAKKTTLQQITSATTGASDNLQHLVRAGLDSILAHVCLVEANGLFATDATPPWRWVVRGRDLCFVGPAFTASVAGRREDLPESARGRTQVELEVVRDRARRFGIVLREIRMRTRSRTVAYDSTVGESIVDDPQLDEIGATLGNPTVARAEAQLGGDMRLSCDYVTGTSGLVAPRAQTSIGELVRTAIQLLEPLTDAESEELTSALQTTPTATDPDEPGVIQQPSLFDDTFLE